MPNFGIHRNSGDPLTCNELRLGNIVSLAGEPKRVTHVTGQLVISRLNKTIEVISVTGYHGLPLNNEWIEKLELEYANDDKKWGDKHSKLTLIPMGNALFEEHLQVSVEYVHELQNLLFAVRKFDVLLFLPTDPIGLPN